MDHPAALALEGSFGAAGGLGGLLAARLAAWAVDYGAAVWLPDFPFKPESFFVLPWWLMALALAAAIGAAVLGAAWPAIRTARASVAQVLADA